jgi:hypothetical protein
VVLIYYIITEFIQFSPLIFLSFGSVGRGSEELAFFPEGVEFEIVHIRCRFPPSRYFV